MRLINSEDVKALINSWDSLPWEEEVDELIDRIPTAFDVDKVVKKLKHRQYMLLEETKKAKSYSHQEELIENIRHYEYAINMVKEGGKDE